MTAPDTEITTDVLVIGGSLSGAWAALSAQEAGASVTIVDKAWIGTAGVVAAATGGGYFLLPDDPDQRARTIRIRHDQAEGLDDLAFCERVYEQSYRCYRKLAEWGFRTDRMGSFRGPDSMVFLRNQLKRVGVQIIDHSPALELLSDASGTIVGAAGLHRKTGKTWQIRAGAVILATGGNAFRSGAMGTGGSTGDGYLLAAEAGVDAVGMEFSGHYGFAPEDSSCTKGGMYHLYGQIFDEDGVKLDHEVGWAAVPAAGRALIEGKKVYAQLDIDPKNGPSVRSMMPNFFNYFDRNGIEPFNTRWPVGLVFEGTVRAAGGLIVGDGTVTSAAGLYAVGDVADKTRLTGAQMSGAGAAIAWCVTSGEWGGKAAAAFARAAGPAHGQRKSIMLGEVGVRPLENGVRENARHIEALVKEEVLPLDKNLFRDAATLERSLTVLDDAWAAAVRGLGGAGDGRERVRAREAAAHLVTARWMYRAAEQRRETRGLHRRRDFPALDPQQARNLRVGGMSAVRVSAA
jgi:succinate dehydrogenase/fumarate reductase flavoprotein subunit